MNSSSFENRSYLLASNTRGTGHKSTSFTSAWFGDKRARLWRYLRDYSDDPSLPERVGEVEPRFARVKELLESCEIAKLVEKAIARGAQPVTSVLDVACGHGLVGLLVAYLCPRQLRVVSVDRTRRPAFGYFWQMARRRSGT